MSKYKAITWADFFAFLGDEDTHWCNPLGEHTCIGGCHESTCPVWAALPDAFTVDDLDEAVACVLNPPIVEGGARDAVRKGHTR